RPGHPAPAAAGARRGLRAAAAGRDRAGRRRPRERPQPGRALGRLRPARGGDGGGRAAAGRPGRSRSGRRVRLGDHGAAAPRRGSRAGAGPREGNAMFDKFSRSWEMVKASAAVLRSDRELMLFAVLSGLATLVVAASFALPVLALRLFGDGIGLGGMALGFAFYFCMYSVMVFFNCDLVGAAMIRLEGGDPTLSDGFAA